MRIKAFWGYWFHEKPLWLRDIRVCAHFSKKRHFADFDENKSRNVRIQFIQAIWA